MTRRRDDHGFTLVELTVAVSIMGIIASTVVMLFAFTVRTTEETSNRFTDSRGPKFVSAYWVPDVSSSEHVNLNSGPCGGGAPQASFSWTDDRAAFGVVTASWYAEDTAGGRSLIRRECRNGDLSTPVRTTVVVPRISSPGVTVACDGGTCAEDATPGSVQITVSTPNGLDYIVDGTRQVRSTQ